MIHCKWFAIIISVLTAACASPPPLKVSSYTMRDLGYGGLDPMARNEKLRRLHGAVTREESIKKLGHYYTIHWHESDLPKAPVSITFEYQQVATGSETKIIRKEFPEYMSSGTTEVSITGEDYLLGGRVLAWRTTLRRGDEIVATRHSYLWQ